MHERTQRAVARLLFVFCCAVPTLFVSSSILVTWTPWYKSRVLSELTYDLNRETGLAFQIDAFEVDAPGRYTLRRVLLIDPETRADIASIRTLEYFEDSKRIGIVIHQPEIQSDGLRKLWAAIHERLLSSPGHTVKPISVVLADVSVRSQTGSLPFSSLSATLTPEGRNLRLVARADSGGSSAGRSSSRPTLRVELFRDRTGARPVTELVLTTDGSALPCSILADYSLAIRKLGPDARFSGTLKCNQSASGWLFDFGASSLSDINLSYATEDLAHRLIGRADVKLQRGMVRPGEMVNLVGTVKATDVRMQVPLLTQLRDQLGWELNEGELAAHPDGIQCNLAAVHFEITDATMNLAGVCDKYHGGVAPDIALFSRGIPLARTGSHRIESQQITNVLGPPNRHLAIWNQILLPAAPVEKIAARPRGELRGIRPWTGNETVQQE